MVLDIRFHHPEGVQSKLHPVAAGEYIAVPDFSQGRDETLAIHCSSDDEGVSVFRIPGQYAKPNLVPRPFPGHMTEAGELELVVGSGETKGLELTVGGRLVGTLALAHTPSPRMRPHATLDVEG